MVDRENNYLSNYKGQNITIEHGTTNTINESRNHCQSNFDSSFRFSFNLTQPRLLPFPVSASACDSCHKNTFLLMFTDLIGMGISLIT